MTRKHFMLTTLLITLLITLMSGCGSIPTPDPSIVWSDDFDDGDTEGWEIEVGMEDKFTVEEGIVSFLTRGTSPILVRYRVVPGAPTFSFQMRMKDSSC